MDFTKIALITDSSCDLPADYISEHNLFVLPLHINMTKGQFLDGVNIAPKEIYDELNHTIPTTSQPTPDDIKQLFNRVKKSGYTEAVVVSISSAMSGTHDLIKLCAKEEKELNVRIFDSKRLSMALGLMVMQAVELREEGLNPEGIIRKLESTWKKTNGYFCIPTLKFLMKGGRIGLVQGTIGSILGIVPIISCNDDGKYYSYAKTRGYQIAIKRIIDTVKETISGKMADIAILYGNALDKAKELLLEVKQMKGIRNIIMNQVGAAMIVHSGPGLIGIAYRILD